ncbi:MAG: hypothetical protein ACREIA_01205 [Opitutaceae bacterium]
MSLTPSTEIWGRVRYSEDDIFVSQDLWTDSANNMLFGFLPEFGYYGKSEPISLADFASLPGRAMPGRPDLIVTRGEACVLLLK